MRTLAAALDAATDPAVQKAAADTATATGVLTLPWWVDAMTYGYHGVTAAGALALLVGRLVLLWREIQEKRRPAPKAKRSPGNALDDGAGRAPGGNG